jgi:hypothetical protein
MTNEENKQGQKAEKSTECDCRICTLSRTIRDVSERGNVEEMRKTLNDLLDNFMCTDMDLCYYKSILDGSWPDAKEHLSKALVDVISQEKKS